MNRGEAVSEIQRVLGYRSDKATEAALLLNYQQQECERQPDLPWFLREENTAMVSVAGDPRLPLPTGFLKEWQEDPLAVQTLNASGLTIWKTLAKDTPSYLRETTQETGDLGFGFPLGYNRDAVSFILFPTPDDIYTFRMIYYKADVVLAVDADENKWLINLPYLLIGRAGLRIAGAVRDQSASQTFGLMIQESMAKINNWNTELEEAGARRIVGGPD